MAYKGNYVLTISADMVGDSRQQRIKLAKKYGANNMDGVRDALGEVLPGDVGKQVFNVDGVFQVENDQQRDVRLARQAA